MCTFPFIYLGNTCTIPDMHYPTVNYKLHYSLYTFFLSSFSQNSLEFFQTHKYTVLAFSELCFCLLFHIYIIFNKFTFEYFNLSIKTKPFGPLVASKHCKSSMQKTGPGTQKNREWRLVKVFLLSMR